MKDFLKKTSPYVMFAAAWTLIFAAILLGERVPAQISLVLFTLGGVLMADYRAEPHPAVPGTAKGV